MPLRLLIAWLIWAVPAIASAEAWRQVPAVLHAHSDFSTGDFPLDRLVALAESQGVDALLLAENYHLKVEYGLFPFRSLLRFTREEPSVLSRGAENYLSSVAEVRRRFPRMLVLPGVEVVPQYVWRGSLLTGDLTMWNLQKNILVFGVTDPEALKRLPTTGNPALARPSIEGLIDALPGLLILPGLWLLLRKRRSRKSVGRFVVVEEQRPWLSGSLLVLIGVAVLVWGYPFYSDPWSPYRDDLGVEAHQALIDQVEALGGATVWSFPEAGDFSQQKLFFLSLTVKTEPYPDDLIRTFRYTGFGGIYEQPTRFTEPGGNWDYLLGKYLAGERSRPSWAVGESGFHGLRGAKKIGPIQTVFLVREKSEAAILEALKAGRMYALRRGPGYALSLDDFALVRAKSGRPEAKREQAPGREIPEAAVSGETLAVPAGGEIEVRGSIQASDGGEHPIRVTLVRNGEIARVWAAKTPFRIAHRDGFAGRPAYYRLDVRGPSRDHHLLSNPIFVKPSQQ